MGTIRSILIVTLLVAGLGVPASADRMEREVDLVNETTLRSPDGNWIVTTGPETLFDDGYARLSIKGRDGENRTLLTYGRSGKIIWSADSSFLVFLDNCSADRSAIRLFTVDNSGPHELQGIDERMRATVDHELGTNTLLFYYVSLISLGKDQLTVRASAYFVLPGVDRPSHKIDFLFHVRRTTATVELVRESRMK